MKKPEVLSIANSIIGTVTACAALYVAIHANGISNQIARKSADPLLIYEVKDHPDAESGLHQLELQVHNVGLGPAVILGFEVYKGGELVAGRAPVHSRDMASSFGFGEQSVSGDELRYGQVISANERATLFKVNAWRKPLTVEEFSELLRNALAAHLVIFCYRSVYPDKYYAAVKPGTKLPASSCAWPGYFKRFPPQPDPMRIELAAPD